MSKNTSVEMRKLFLYQVYLRSHTASGTIVEFIQDLDRIQDLGTDIVYFMPIHPIGTINRKGSLGCPYSIQDYRAINPEYGTLEDFKNAINEIHSRNMKVMIDVVYNHTSHDSVLLQTHPEYFLHVNGKLISKEPSWSDIQDFDFQVSKDLWTELIDILLYWMNIGVDGFRFDVGSFLPQEFLEIAGKQMRKLNPEVILLSESVHGGYCRYMRNKGYEVLSESEIYQVFDMAYDYDVQPFFENYLKGSGTLNQYLKEILRQEEIYPKNYVKMRNLENHDFGRFAKFVNADPIKIDNWTGFVFFEKGSVMMYAGEEFSETHQPSLFEKEDVLWTGRDLSDLVKKLAKIKKMDHLTYGVFDIHLQDKEVIVASYTYQNETIVGIFNVGDDQGTIQVPVEDGEYSNVLDNTIVKVSNQTVELTKRPVIFIK